MKGVIEKFGGKANDSTKMLVAAEKEFEDFKLFKRQEYTNMYTDLVDWLCFLYDHPRLKLLEE